MVQSQSSIGRNFLDAMHPWKRNNNIREIFFFRPSPVPLPQHTAQLNNISAIAPKSKGEDTTKARQEDGPTRQNQTFVRASLQYLSTQKQNQKMLLKRQCKSRKTLCILLMHFFNSTIPYCISKDLASLARLNLLSTSWLTPSRREHPLVRCYKTLTNVYFEKN